MLRTQLLFYFDSVTFAYFCRLAYMVTHKSGQPADVNPAIAITLLQTYVANRGINYPPRRLLAANSLSLDIIGCVFFKLCVNVAVVLFAVKRCMFHIYTDSRLAKLVPRFVCVMRRTDIFRVVPAPRFERYLPQLEPTKPRTKTNASKRPRDVTSRTNNTEPWQVASWQRCMLLAARSLSETSEFAIYIYILRPPIMYIYRMREKGSRWMTACRMSGPRFDQ